MKLIKSFTNSKLYIGYPEVKKLNKFNYVHVIKFNYVWQWCVFNFYNLYSYKKTYLNNIFLETCIYNNYEINEF